MKERRQHGGRYWEGAGDEVAKNIDVRISVYKVENRKVKRCNYQSKKEVSEQFGRKRNQGVDGNRKLFWKDVKWNGGKVESKV